MVYNLWLADDNIEELDHETDPKVKNLVLSFFYIYLYHNIMKCWEFFTFDETRHRIFVLEAMLNKSNPLGISQTTSILQTDSLLLYA